MYNEFGGTLSNLALAKHRKSRAINAENPRGEKGKGGMAASDLGPSRKGCISVWSTYYETSCRIDKELCLIVNHILWKNWIKYIFLDVLMDLLLGNILVVLC